MWRLAIVILVACAGSPRRDLPPAPPGAQEVLLDAGYRVAWPWVAVRLDARGTRTDEHYLRAGQCLAVIVSDPSVQIEAGGATAPSTARASWLVGCVPTDGPVPVTLQGEGRGRVVVGLFIGMPEANAHVLLAEHFQYAVPEAEQAPTTLLMQENACGEDEARAHYQRGMELAREEKFAEAGDALALAYACHADGTILFNLATVTAQRGREQEAREMFAQLLRDHSNLPDERRTQVQESLDRLLRPGTIRIRVARGDELFVNEVRYPFEGRHAEVVAMPGSHRVLLRSSDGERHEVRVQLRSTQTVEIDPRLWVSTAESE